MIGKCLMKSHSEQRESTWTQNKGKTSNHQDHKRIKSDLRSEFIRTNRKKTGSNRRRERKTAEKKLQSDQTEERKDS